MASLLVLAGFLAACGNGGGGNNGGGGSLPPNPAFTLSFSPDKTTFTVGKNSSASLTVNTNILWDQVQKVRVTFDCKAVVGLHCPTTPPVIIGNGSITATVSLDSTLTINKPYFTVTAVGLDKDDRVKGSSPESVTFQWTAQ